MPTLHKITAQLYDNLLTSDNTKDYIARTISERSLNIKDICEAAVSRGGAEISATAMEHATALFLKEMAYQLCDGYAVNTGYFIAKTKIRGVFNSPDETYDPDKHEIRFQFNQGEKLRTEIPNIEINILGMADSDSTILQVTDIKSGSINDILTPGKNLKISGKKIKIAGDNVGNGVYFINAVSNSRTVVSNNDIVVNKASELIIMIPNLPVGNYQLEIISQYSGSNLLKASKIARYNHILTVE